MLITSRCCEKVHNKKELKGIQFNPDVTYLSAVLADLIIKELPQKAQNSKLWRDAGGYMPSPFSHLQAVLVCEDKYFIKKPAEYTCICLRGQIIRKACPRKTITAAIADAVETWEYAQKGIIQ